jgi:hypothetical protein
VARRAAHHAGLHRVGRALGEWRCNERRPRQRKREKEENDAMTQ